MKVFRIFIATIVMALLLNTWVLAAPSEVDVSTRKPASASGFSSPNVASRGNDGSKTSLWECDWQNLKNIWWQVDLGKPYLVSKVDLYFRELPNGKERSNIEIQASNDAEFNTYTVLGALGSEPHAGDATWTIETDCKNVYRYVRYRKIDDSYTTMSELTVYAIPSDFEITSATYFSEDEPSIDELKAGKRVGIEINGKNNTESEKYLNVLITLCKNDIVCDVVYKSVKVDPNSPGSALLFFDEALPDDLEGYSVKTIVFDDFGTLYTTDNHIQNILLPGED